METEKDKILTILKKDYEKLMKKGSVKINLASCYHNTIREPLWDIKIKQACPPYLHILLGIIKSIMTCQKKELHEVDLKIAQSIVMSKPKLGLSAFHVYIQSVQDRRKLSNQLSFLQAEIDEGVCKCRQIVSHLQTSKIYLSAF